ncbi:MAG: DMT family transporter [Sandaracinaceae bacterium]|nr:DMT family transporter [Sandaracinaceae bacterium]
MSEPTAASKGASAKVHVALFGVQIAFATLSIAGKDALQSFAPSSIAFLRMAGATLVLLAFTAARVGVPRVPWRDAAKIFGLALLGIVFNQLLFLLGLKRTTPINATLLTCTIPIFTVLIALVLGREKTRWQSMVGVFISFFGIVFLVGTESISFGLDVAVGDLLIVLNAFSYAVYLVLVRPVIEKYGALTVMTLAFLFGTLAMAPLGIPELIESAPRATPHAWRLVAFLVLVPTVFTYLLNAWALRRAPASLVAIYIYVQPIATALFNILLGRGHPSSNVIAAGLLVFVGIALVTRPRRDTEPGVR